jgi:hypothetical protein
MYGKLESLIDQRVRKAAIETINSLPGERCPQTPSMTVERDPRATTAQQCSKGLILLKKQTTYLSKALILHAHEIGTFCIDCTGTPALAK